MEITRVVIIGAGPIGLELAVALKQEGIEYLQFDASSIGATIGWYPQQMLFHSNAERLAIAGVAIQTADQQKPTREEYLAYLRAVVMQYGLQIRNYEHVSSVKPIDGAGDGAPRFEVLTSRSRILAGFVVIAIGSMHRPDSSASRASRCRTSSTTSASRIPTSASDW